MKLNTLENYTSVWNMKTPEIEMDRILWSSQESQSTRMLEISARYGL